MGKCWTIKETSDWKKGKLIDLDLQNTETGQVLAIVTEYDFNPMESVREKLQSIICLAAEGPEAESHAKLFEAIAKEALKTLDILEGK
jgi:hypothetical protein